MEHDTSFIVACAVGPGQRPASMGVGKIPLSGIILVLAGVSPHRL